MDTATPAVTVALHDGSSVVAETGQVDARRHGELLLPAVHRVLSEAGVTLDDVTDIAVGVGPGPYTGLRVGLVTAATFGSALSLPVHGVCTLDALAHASGLDGPFAVATDARRKEVYWARYDDVRTRVGEPGVDRPADIAESLAGLPVVGAGALLYPEAFPDARGPEHVSMRRARLPRRRTPGRRYGAAPAAAALPPQARRAGPEELQGGHPEVTTATAVLREMRWWDIAPVLELEHELFPDDAWSAGDVLVGARPGPRAPRHPPLRRRRGPRRPDRRLQPASRRPVTSPTSRPSP